MQSVYAWYGSRIHLLLEDEFADTWNRAQDKWYEAQTLFELENERKWNPREDPIKIYWTDEEKKARDDLAELIDILIRINGGGLDIPEEELTSDYLEKIEI